MKTLLTLAILAIGLACLAVDEKLKLEGASYKVTSVDLGPKVNIIGKFEQPGKMASAIEKKIVINLSSFAPSLAQSKEAVDFVEKQLKGRYIKLLPMQGSQVASMATMLRSQDKPLTQRDSGYFVEYHLYAVDLGGKRIDRLYDEWAQRTIEAMKTPKEPGK